MDTEELKSRLKNVKKRIKKAAEKSGRNEKNISLVAVSKTHPAKKIKFFHEKGLNIFGESRVQNLREKNNKIKNLDISWHFVGHLQTNKVKYLLRMKRCKMIESLDSLRLAKEINKRAEKNNKVMPLLVEVNVSRDENKYGIKPGNTVEFIKKVDRFSNIEIKGLMALAPYMDNPEDSRPYFKEIVKLKEKVNSKGFNLKELSLGMSNDFEIAIEEGSTMVRIGTALFGPRQY